MIGTVPRFKYRGASSAQELRGTSAATFETSVSGPPSLSPLESVAALRQRLSNMEGGTFRQVEPNRSTMTAAAPHVSTYLADSQQTAPTGNYVGTIPQFTSTPSLLSAASLAAAASTRRGRYVDVSSGSHDAARGFSPLPSAPSSAPERSPAGGGEGAFAASFAAPSQREDTAAGLYVAQPPLQPLNLPSQGRATQSFVPHASVQSRAPQQRHHSRAGAAPLQWPSSRDDVVPFTAEDNNHDRDHDDDDDSTSVASTASLPPLPGEDVPVVPPEVLKYCAEPLAWQGHPCAPIVLSLLNARCVFLPAQQDLVSYHMAPGFLYALQHLQLGSYFVKYGIRRSAPKERFFSIRCLENSLGHVVPYLTWTLHQHAHQLVDKVPLTQFVGVTTGVGEEAFQRYMLDGNIIKGCRQGPHHAKLPTTGAMTLWFYDLRKQAARSLSLLTCSTSVFDLWTSTLKGIAAVNSVQIREVGMSTTAPPTTDQLLREAQYQVRNAVNDYDDGDDDLLDASF